NTVLTKEGALQVDTRGEPDPVRAIDRLWPPNGWASVELADGTRMPALREPAMHRTTKSHVEVKPAFYKTPDERNWRRFELPRPPAPPPGFADLVDAPSTPDFAGAMDYSARINLPARGFDYRAELAKLFDPDLDEEVVHELVYGRLFPGSQPLALAAYVVPALLAIAAEPSCPFGLVLAEALTTRLHAALEKGHRAVIHAFRLAVPMMTGAQRVADRLGTAFGLSIALVARAEDYPAWWLELIATNSDIRRFADPVVMTRELANLDDTGDDGAYDDDD
ncbi:MAG TPA: hypothetical protein VGC41_06730, partial [Kofleriaceae bacterium]